VAAAAAAAAIGLPYVGAPAPMSHTAASLAALAVGSTARAVLVGTLHGHEAPVTALRMSSEWSLIVSGDSEGTVIVWDLNRLAYVRTLPPSAPGAVAALAISLPHGDIYSSDGRDMSERHTIGERGAALWHQRHAGGVGARSRAERRAST
jgi:hypothetical protein